MSEATYYRVQLAERDVNDLLDPGYQFSYSVNGGISVRGVSVCDSVDDLALYLVSQGTGVMKRQSGDYVLVELQGEPSGDAPLDPDFESLIIPTRIVSVRPVDEAFMALIAEKDAFLASFTDPNLED